MTSQKTQHENACSYWLTTYNKAKGQIILLIIIKIPVFASIHTMRAILLKKNKSLPLIKPP